MFALIWTGNRFQKRNWGLCLEFLFAKKSAVPFILEGGKPRLAHKAFVMQATNEAVR